MMMDYIAPFLVGVFACNGIPHLVTGLQGKPFPSPFAKPPGIGDSSPLVNVLWGSFNWVVALWLLHDWTFAFALTTPMLLFAAGFVLMSATLAVHFGKVMARRRGSNG